MIWLAAAVVSAEFIARQPIGTTVFGVRELRTTGFS
jgi:hypothetical protein